jgi:hypothetical protein
MWREELYYKIEIGFSEIIVKCSIACEFVILSPSLVLCLGRQTTVFLPKCKRMAIGVTRPGAAFHRRVWMFLHVLVGQRNPNAWSLFRFKERPSISVCLEYVTDKFMFFPARKLLRHFSQDRACSCEHHLCLCGISCLLVGCLTSLQAVRRILTQKIKDRYLIFTYISGIKL